MKILKIGGVLLLAAATVFFGFHFFFGQEREPNAVVEDEGEEQALELAYYKELSVTLETELSALKQEQYAASVAYEERISALELLLQSKEPEAEKAEESDVVYTYTVENNAITITGYSGTAPELTIPSSIDGLPVVTIGREAFKNSALTKVVIPESVGKIDWFAFYGSGMLECVVIPSSVTKIEYGVFDGCSRLTIRCEKNSYADRYAKSYGMRIEN